MTPPMGPWEAQFAQYLAPAPNTTYGSVLPIARDNTTGAMRLALPSSVRVNAKGTGLARTGSVVAPRTADAAAGFRDAGIPGIRYLDGGSRAAGEGTRNYVMFDPATIAILRKYGLAAMLAGGGADAIANATQQGS